MSFWSTLRKLFRSNKVSVYVAMGDDRYMQAAGKLQNAGIPYYTKIQGSFGSSQFTGLPLTRMNEYEIFVKREYEEKARYVITDNG